MQNYRIESKRGQGTYSQVFQAISRLDNQKYALKVLKQKYHGIESIKKDKQIKALKTLSHPHIIKLIDVLFSPQEGTFVLNQVLYKILLEKLALVFQLMECNLYEYYKNKPRLHIEKIRSIGHDILQAVSFLHQKGLFHRDIKPQNILVSYEKQIKLADFGSCKHALSHPPFTQYIATRWYRAPQCLLTDGFYTQKMDVWSIGCVLFQLFSQYPLFPGKNQIDQISIIFSVLGSPSNQLLNNFASRSASPYIPPKNQGIGIQTLIPEAPTQLLDLIKSMLEIDPKKRIDASEALNHPFFYALTQLKKYRKNIINKISEGKDLRLPLLKSRKRQKRKQDEK